MLEDKEMGTIDVSPAIERFADKIKLIGNSQQGISGQQVKIKVEKNYK